MSILRFNAPFSTFVTVVCSPKMAEKRDILTLWAAIGIVALSAGAITHCHAVLGRFGANSSRRDSSPVISEKPSTASTVAPEVPDSTPDKTTVSIQNGKLVNGALQARKAGDSAKVIDACTLALSSGADLPLAYALRGEAYLKLHDVPRARQDFRKAVDSDPEDALSSCGCGIANFYLNDFSNAIRNLNQSVSFDEHFADAFYYRGMVERAQDHLEQAVADFSKAIQLDPSDSDATTRRDEARQALALSSFQLSAHPNGTPVILQPEPRGVDLPTPPSTVTRSSQVVTVNKPGINLFLNSFFKLKTRTGEETSDAPSGMNALFAPEAVYNDVVLPNSEAVAKVDNEDDPFRYKEYELGDFTFTSNLQSTYDVHVSFQYRLGTDRTSSGGVRTSAYYMRLKPSAGSFLITHIGTKPIYGWQMAQWQAWIGARDIRRLDTLADPEKHIVYKQGTAFAELQDQFSSKEEEVREIVFQDRLNYYHGRIDLGDQPCDFFPVLAGNETPAQQKEKSHELVTKLDRLRNLRIEVVGNPDLIIASGVLVKVTIYNDMLLRVEIVR